MPLDAPHPAEPSARLPLDRRLSAWIVRLGAARATLVVMACGSVCSAGLTWIFLHASGFHAMGNALWISLLVPLPLALLFGGTCIMLVVALEASRQQVQELAWADPLTGLGNRRRFLPSAQREIDLSRRHHQPLGLLLLDIDHFKRINDTHGHSVGDLALVEIGRRCTSALRATDLLARWGGEEFIMLLPNTSTEQACQLAERLRKAVSATPLLPNHVPQISVTVSIGAAGARHEGDASLDALIHLADRALYAAKHAGRDRVVLSDTQAETQRLQPC